MDEEDKCVCSASLGHCECDICVCDTPPDECVCDPCGCDDICICDPPTDEEEEECICEPCDCELPQPICRCQEPKAKEDIQEIVKLDPLDEFVKRLEQQAIAEQAEFCRTVCAALESKTLTADMIYEIMVEDDKGRPVIYLHGNQLISKHISQKLMDKDMETLKNVMNELHAVPTISIPYNNVGDAGLEILGNILIDHECVQNINVMNNEITAYGISKFVQQLQKRPPLYSLRLSGNKFGNNAFDALSSLAVSGHFPRDFDGSECDMSEDGFISLSSALISLDRKYKKVNQIPLLPIDFDDLDFDDIESLDPIAGFVKEMFDQGEKTALETLAFIEKMKIAKYYCKAATEFVGDLFQQTQDFINHAQQDQDPIDKFVRKLFDMSNKRAIDGFKYEEDGEEEFDKQEYYCKEATDIVNELFQYYNQPSGDGYQEDPIATFVKDLLDMDEGRTGPFEGDNEDECNEALFEQTQKFIQNQYQDPIANFVKTLFDKGEKMALDTYTVQNQVKQAVSDYCNKGAESTVNYLIQYTQEFMKNIHDFELRERSRISRPRRLVLNRPLFRPERIKQMVILLGNYIKDNLSIKELIIRKWMLGEEGLEDFMTRIMNNNTITLLDLSCNSLACPSVKLLAEYMVTNQKLKHVILSHNPLRNPGITHIGEVIAKTRLLSLNVSFTDATDTGLDFLLGEISSSHVNALYIWGNTFGRKTWDLFNKLTEGDDPQIKYTDTLLEKREDGSVFLVKNSQFCDTNYWYDIPPSQGQGKYLEVPPYYRKTEGRKWKKRESRYLDQSTIFGGKGDYNNANYDE